jgi:F0F1-type ATP synthase membrane subunit b/b'
MSLDPLAQINVATIGAMVLIFIATLLLLRPCLVSLIEVMERRAAKLAAARAEKAEAMRMLEGARQESEKALASAREQAERRAAEIQEELGRLRTERLAHASAEAELVLARGREEAADQRRAETTRLSAEVGSCAVATLTQMVGQVDEAAVRLMAHRVLAAQETR